MSEESYEDFEETGLSMSQQLELEDLIVKTAFNNSFDVLTKRKTITKQ